MQSKLMAKFPYELLLTLFNYTFICGHNVTVQKEFLLLFSAKFTIKTLEKSKSRNQLIFWTEIMTTVSLSDFCYSFVTWLII